MKKIVTLMLVLVSSVMLQTVVFAEAPDTINESKYQIKWSDEFNGTELNRNNWTPQVGNGSSYGIWEWGNNEKQYYKANNVSVADGKLQINAKYEPAVGKVGDTTYNFSSARITSASLVNVGLGYVEAKISIPKAKGIWPAFWMLGTNGKVWPSCGEIDIMEAFNVTNVLQSTIHYPKWDGSDKYLYAQKKVADKTQWHTFGCYRDGEVIAFYIDRQLLCKFNTYDLTSGTSAGKRSVLNDDYYILLNVACGGNLAGGMPDTTLDATMYVDYVRYYVDKPEVPTTTIKTSGTGTVKKPSKATIKSIKNIKKKKIKVTLKKVTGAKGYQIRWCENKKFDGYESKTTSKTTYTIKHLEKKQTYYVKARAYKLNQKTKLYGKWSKVKKIKIKK